MNKTKYFINKKGFKDFLEQIKNVFGESGEKYYLTNTNGLIHTEIDGTAIYNAALQLENIFENPIYKSADKYFPVPSFPDVFIQKYIFLSFDYTILDCLWFEMFCASRFIATALMEHSTVNYSENFDCCYYDLRQIQE